VNAVERKRKVLMSTTTIAPVGSAVRFREINMGQLFRMPEPGIWHRIKPAESGPYVPRTKNAASVDSGKLAFVEDETIVVTDGFVSCGVRKQS
jgi:hypothetical protein